MEPLYPDSPWIPIRRARARFLRNTRNTERGAKLFLTPLAVRAAPFALPRNTRKTERGAPFAPLSTSSMQP